MGPGAELHGSCQLRRALVLIVPILDLAHDQGGILDAEVCAVSVPLLGVAHAGAGGIAVEEAKEQRNVVVWIQLYSYSGSCERIGRTAARQVDRQTGWPPERAVDELSRVL